MKYQPFHLLLIQGVLFIGLSFLTMDNDRSVDIFFHESYVVVSKRHLLSLLGIIALFIWFFHWVTKGMMYSSTLEWIHVLICIGILLLLALSLFIGDSLTGPMSRNYYNFSHLDLYDNFRTFAEPIGVILLGLQFGHLIFLVNLFWGIYRNFKFGKD